MKAILKLVVALHIFFYKLTGGKFGGTMGKGKVLLLTTKGRKTGLMRTVPLGYIEDAAGNPIICASYAGQPNNPAWYDNMVANGEVSYQVGPRVVPAKAEIAEGALREQLWNALVEKLPGYLDYKKKTTRVIPMITLKAKA